MFEEIFHRLLERPTDANKYDFGHVLVVGGSPGMVGAPFLAAEAALRTGAGLVTIASHANIIDKLEKRAEEIMTWRLDDDSTAAVETVMSFVTARKVSVVVIGPGQAPAFAGLAPVLLSKLNVPVVIDAGAITAFHGRLDLLKQAGNHNRNIILTPHAGEYQKLTGHKPPTNSKKLKQLVSRFAKDYSVTLILKGHQTLVARPDGRLYENLTGNPGLATAGTGDVLSGVIAGFLAQRVTDIEAAVYLHGLAGDLAAQAKTQPGMIASDVIDQIPAALRLAARSPAPG
jgi:hydroxyethylthiazole kinase-like uncharacterized protein yjeF